MREIKLLTLTSLPKQCYIARNLIFDRIIFKDEDDFFFDYITPSCTYKGNILQNRTALLKWAWSHSVGDTITISADFSNNSIIRPKILKENN